MLHLNMDIIASLIMNSNMTPYEKKLCILGLDPKRCDEAFEK